MSTVLMKRYKFFFTLPLPTFELELSYFFRFLFLSSDFRTDRICHLFSCAVSKNITCYAVHGINYEQENNKIELDYFILQRRDSRGNFFGKTFLRFRIFIRFSSIISNYIQKLLFN